MFWRFTGLTDKRAVSSFQIRNNHSCWLVTRDRVLQDLFTESIFLVAPSCRVGRVIEKVLKQAEQRVHL